MNFQWKDEHIEFVKARWREGWSAGMIAREMPGKLSRGAILGKLSRLGLLKNRTSTRNHVVKLRGGKLRQTFCDQRSDGKRMALENLPLPPEPENPGGVTFEGLEAGMCRWPFGQGPYTFCGCRSIPNTSYCPTHHAAAWTSVPVRKPKPKDDSAEKILRAQRALLEGVE